MIPTERLVGKYRADRKLYIYRYDGNRRKRMGPPYQELKVIDEESIDE